MIRFAAIPKCASRSLKALGLLGELPGRCHTKITEYPDWEKYEWFAVDRPADDWYRSWWLECKRTRSMFADWLGFKYESVVDDMAKISMHPKMEAPRRPGINAWIPEEFSMEFSESGKSFKKYCFDVITDGVPVEVIPLADLDAWLTARGFEPVHMNAQVEHA